jgi:L-ascorbate metabolism protein UlaG (beta-lactamase superfamily)
VSDAAEIANRCKATLIANYEIATWFANQHRVASTIGMNIGGRLQTSFGSVKMVNAVHSSQLPDGSYGGNPGGFLLAIDGKNIYFACDTALSMEMQCLANNTIDVAVLPIGDLFTMGVDDSLLAIDWLKPKTVLPTHYNTWPPISQDAVAWAEKVRSRSRCQPIVLAPGETYQL